MKIFLIVIAVLLPLTSLHAASPLDELRPFLKQHCYKCHGEKKQENEKRFDTLGPDLSKIETLQMWQEFSTSSIVAKCRPKTARSLTRKNWQRRSKF